MPNSFPRKVTWTEAGKLQEGVCHGLATDLDGPYILVEYAYSGKIEKHRITECSDYKLG